MPLSCLSLLIVVRFFADVYLDERVESRQVNAHLNAAQTHANLIVENFWADQSKAELLSLLQDRISQDRVLAETCRSALAVVHKVMFPLNDQPDGLPALLRRFENGEAIYRFVRRHLHCGTQVALSFMRIQYPVVDMELVKRLPPTPSGRTDMTPHYAAYHRATKFIAAQIIDESDRERALQHPQVA
jgi:hypothetical protein